MSWDKVQRSACPGCKLMRMIPHRSAACWPYCTPSCKRAAQASNQQVSATANGQQEG